MVVKIRIASVKGDIPQILELPQARAFVDGYTQRGWISAINGRVGTSGFIEDGDEVKLYPAIGGG